MKDYAYCYRASARDQKGVSNFWLYRSAKSPFPFSLNLYGFLSPSAWRERHDCNISKTFHLQAYLGRKIETSVSGKQ